MSKSIYEEALESYGHVNAIVQNKKSHLTWEEEVHHLANITRALQQAQKQEQEHIEYSKKVKEQFSNDTKRIGELESKIIRQEKLLDLYRKFYKYYDNLMLKELFDIENKIMELEDR